MRCLTLVVVSLVALSGCKERDPAYCASAAHVGDPGCPGASVGDGPCKTNSDCTGTPGFPACDTMDSGGTCVECTASDHALCTGTTPLCDNHMCVACINDGDCGAGGLCLPSGACARLSDVAYVDGTNGVDNASCTMSQPCTRIDVAAGLKLIVKVSGTVKDRCILNGSIVTILGQPGAKLIPIAGNDGPAFEIKGASHVEVYDLEINQATGTLPAKDGSGVLVEDSAEVLMTRVKLLNNTVYGADVKGGHLTCTLCTINQNTNLGVNVAGALLTISQSTIGGNMGGGISISTGSSFQIVGNVILGNGQNNSLTGGINIQVNGSSVNRLDFNSLSHNTALNGVGPGIQCTSGMPLTANNNIIWDNGTGTPAPPQVASPGGCDYAYSDIGPTSVQAGTNMSTLPQFKDEVMDLHLMPTSPVRRMADPNADLSGLAVYDIDGDKRVSRADLGADQTP